MFLHGGPWHIGFNMLALWMFGNILERVWGMKRFLKYYFFCGLGAGLLVTTLAFITGDGYYSTTIGASGAVLGLLAAFGILFPNNIIYMYFLPVKARYAVWIFGGLSLMFATTNLFAGISHWGHLGGILFGFIFLYWRTWLKKVNL
jgi:membrane associated rhomboid family serine protease